jgi:glycosyltransferase involved in cell wall biosynthesis
MPQPRALKVEGHAIVEGGSIEAADCVLVESDHAAARVIAQGADPSRVVTLPPGVDRSVFSPDGEAADGPDGALRILWIGDDCDELDRAAHSLPGIRIAGAADRRWLTRVEVLSPEWYRWADAVLFTGQPEVAAMARALACGRPCVAPDSEASREVLTHRWDALLYAPGGLDAALREIADAGLRARLAAPARTSSERFDAAAVAAREAAIRNVLLQREQPLVSVVLPTYRRAHLIEAAVHNVLAQDYANFELIVVNDGSPDDTRERLERLQAELDNPRLRVIHRDNGGLPVALNTGFAAATGEFWTWTSDDNAYKPGALRALARELQVDPSTGLVFSDMEVVREDGRRREFKAGPIELLRERCVVSASFMYRRAVAEVVGDYDPQFRLVEDYDYWLRVARVAAMRHLKRDLYLYGDVPDSLSRTRFNQVIDAHVRVLRREFGHTPAGDENIYNYLTQCTSWNKNSGRALVAARVARKMIRLRPLASAGWWALLRALTPRPLLNLSRRARGLDES